MLSSGSIAVSAVIIVVSSLVCGLTGFGFNLVAVPLMVLFLPAKDGVVVTWLLGMVTHLSLLATTYRQVDLRKIWPLAVAGVVGAQLGTYLLLIANAATLKLIVGVVIAISALAFLCGLVVKVRNERKASLAVGLMSGVLGGSTSMSGPPVVLFFRSLGVDKSAFRANLVAFLLLLEVVRIPYSVAGGLVTSDVLRLTAMMIPAMLLGMGVGIKLVHRVDETLFQKMTLIIVLIAGITSIAAAL